MARIVTKKAAKDYPEQGIKKGQTYYWWKTRPGGRGNGIIHKSLTRPTRSQMTQSDFLGFQYTMEDETLPGFFSVDGDDLDSAREDAVSEMREKAEEQEEKLQNMPESLQQSPTGELLEERGQCMNDWADELEGVEIPDAVEEPGAEPIDPCDDEPLRSDFADEAGFDAAVTDHKQDLEVYENDHAEWEDATSAFDEYEMELETCREELAGCSYPG